jgi:PBSX family phage portal protein
MSEDKSKDALRKMRARVFEVRKQINDEAGKSHKIENDPFQALGVGGKIIEPPFDLLSLTLMLERNTELQQCIESYEVNIESFGHRFVPRIRGNLLEDLPEDLSNKIRLEKIRLENFFANVTIKDSFISFRRKLRKDLELTGNAYIEVVRTIGGEIQNLVQIPSYQMRLGTQEKQYRLVEIPIYELQEDGSVKVILSKQYRRFRKYVQQRFEGYGTSFQVSTSNIMWYKEFLDPADYNCSTGEQEDNLPIDKKASEIIHLDLYSARSAYGLPRYIGNLLSIFGDRAAEEINYVTFKNNNIPSMAILCANGQLTEGSIKRIEDFVESQIQGSDNYSKFLLIEAEGTQEGEDGSQTKVEIKPLTQEQHKDALFQAYSKNNKDNLRRSFRLPPIFLGSAADYNRASAETSRKLADEQVFAPERNEFDELMNRKIFPSLGIIYHKFQSNSPNTTDNTELVRILATSEKTGGMTPFIARVLLEEILGRDLPPFSDDFDPNVPFSLTMAEAVKNQADPTQPGQQVTALKSDPFVDHLLAVQKAAEKEWAKDMTEDHSDHDHKEE